MATGKSLEKAPKRMLRVWTGKDGQPLRRAVPKIKASKKQRRKARALAKAIEEAQKAQKALAMRHEYIVASKGRFITEGLTFNSEKHEYYYNGRSLSGITGLIGKTMKKNYSSGHVEEGRAQGSHVHSAIEDFVTKGTVSSVHPAASWAINELKGFMDDGFGIYSEVLVSDFEKYASAIDLLLIRQDALYILDTKAGVFDRPYVTWQLSVYKYFLEEFAGLRVSGAYCLSTRHRDIYPIITRPVADVRELLYGRRA